MSISREQVGQVGQVGSAVQNGGASHRPQRSTSERGVTLATVHLLEFYQTTQGEFHYSSAQNPRRILTSPDEPRDNGGFDNEQHDYILRVHDVISSHSGEDYVVIDKLGTGTFGQVVKCRSRRSQEIFAVKVIKNEPAYFRQAQMEVRILEHIHTNSSEEDIRHVVRLLQHFEFRSHLCLVFEKLNINLYEVIQRNRYKGLGLNSIRDFVWQILLTLKVLASLRIIHCDLKPENILLESLDSTAIKIIDFGSACLENQIVYNYVQSRFYRSPEVILGMNYDNKIDMWSLGCIAGELFLGLPLFPGSSEHNMVYRINEMIGNPPDEMLDHCDKAHIYFHVDNVNGQRKYRLKSEQELAREQNKPLEEWTRYFRGGRQLREIVMSSQHRTPTNNIDNRMRECFLHFLQGLLQINPTDRWSPEEAMCHPFVHNKLLVDGENWVPPQRSLHTRSEWRTPNGGVDGRGSPGNGNRSIPRESHVSNQSVVMPRNMQNLSGSEQSLTFGSYDSRSLNNEVENLGSRLSSVQIDQGARSNATGSSQNPRNAAFSRRGDSRGQSRGGHRSNAGYRRGGSDGRGRRGHGRGGNRRSRR
mmetsp:Transcript_13106/g.40362  ORF Transcript_13106/g.40362 Transcript_13106/m.40362 type:complete len:588 (+) Transcript_13106:149-1912(+)